MDNTDLQGAWIERPIRSTEVQEALEVWAEDAIHRLRWSPYTVTQVRKHIRQLAAIAGTNDLALITVDHALVWLRRQPSPQTARTRRSIVGGVFRYLMMRGLVKSNPLAAVTLPRATPGKGADSLTADEMKRLMRVAEADDRDSRSSGPGRARFYLFMWATALRISEAKAQLWDDIDWRSGVMRVTHTKSRRQQTMLLPDWLLSRMKQWPRRGLNLRLLEFVPSHQTVQRDFERAGITGKGIYHRFRKGSISHMARNRASIQCILRHSRHANFNTSLKSYIEVEDSELREAQRLMEI